MQLSGPVEIVVGIILLGLGVMAIESRKLVNSIVYLSLMSMLAVVSFALMKAPDVAITEAVIGSGLVTALFFFTLIATEKAGEKSK